MIDYLLVSALALLATMIVGMFHLSRTTSRSDALCVILLFGTTGVAVVATLAFALNIPDAIDVALVLAMLSAILGVAFVLRAGAAADEES